MEAITELVNLNYAIPVVGVVLCAILVFVFGFKSPAQVPSNAFGDDRKTAAAKKKKNAKKSTPNETSVGSRPVTKVVSNKKAPKNSNEKQVSSPQSKKPKAESVLQQKTKVDIKNKKNEKNAKNVQKKNEVKIAHITKNEGHEEDKGEWVEFVSRKERKIRKRGELNGNIEDDNNQRDGSSKEGTPEKKQRSQIVNSDAETSPKNKKNDAKQKKTKKDSNKDADSNNAKKNVKGKNQDLDIGVIAFNEQGDIVDNSQDGNNLKKKKKARREQ